MTESPYRWVIVALGGLMGCVALGAMFSLAVFLTPMSGQSVWSRALGKPIERPKSLTTRMLEEMVGLEEKREMLTQEE